MTCQQLIIRRQALQDFIIIYPDETDLAGKKAKMEFRKESDNSVVFTMSSDLGSLTVNTSTIDGRITTIPSEQIPLGKFIVDIALEEMGEVSRSEPFFALIKDFVTDAA